MVAPIIVAAGVLARTAAKKLGKKLVEKSKNKTFTDADKAFYSGANKTKEDKAINKMLQEYIKRHRANK